ncbi:MAG: hypothetical protein JNN28_09660 [Saprospiraceae bacterium]|nr:hypothetical protein [Saprospiraceae bacterium]
MIKELTQKEAKKLRDRVLKRFREGHLNGTGFRITQYKDAYKSLAEDIAKVVEGAEVSVSTHRLRKFFYYSDPDVCPEDKLEKPSFGDDFIKAISEYVNKGTRSYLSYSKVAVVLVLVILAIITWQVYSPSKGWEEPFDDLSLEGLSKRGWQILDYDSLAFSNQHKQGCLTAFTYPGGYWVKKDSGEIPFIKNMIVKRMGLENCIVTSRIIDSFNPNQNWQGAGVCLFDSELSYENNLSVFFCYAKHELGGDSIEHWQKIQIVLLKDGKASEKSIFSHLMNNNIQTINEVEFELEIRNRHISVGFRTDANWNSSSIEKFELNLPFSIAFVGVGAAQGHTDHEFHPLNADTIPAFFDYVKIESLDD